MVGRTGHRPDAAPHGLGIVWVDPFRPTPLTTTVRAGEQLPIALLACNDPLGPDSATARRRSLGQNPEYQRRVGDPLVKEFPVVHL